MAVSCSVSKTTGEVIIGIDGRFDFSKVKEFREAYAKAGADYEKYVLDMRNTEHMDSSALGMLLNMRKFLGDDVSIRITNTRPQIRKILAISRFDKKFQID